MAYKAFLSYSQAADARVATAVQSALHQFGRRWYRLRALRIFRDKASLAANPALWPAIERALEASDFFLLMASPEAARSPWVEREAGWWLKNRSAQTLLILWTGGELRWDQDAADFDWSRTDCLPGLLRARYQAEPLHVDLRWARKETDLSLRHSQFHAAVLDIAAPLHGKPKDELDGEDVRQHRRFKAVARLGVGALAVLAVAASVAAYLAYRESQVALARQLAAQAELTRALQPDLTQRSLLLAIESMRRFEDWGLRSLEGDQAVRNSAALLAVPGAELKHPAAVKGVWFAPQGNRLVTAGDDGRLSLWALDGTRKVLDIEPQGRELRVALSPDGRHLATLAQGTVRVLPLSTGPEAFRLTLPGVTALALRGDGKTLITSGEAATQSWDLASGQETRSFRAGKAWKAILSPDGRYLVAGIQSELEVWDVDGGRRLHQMNVEEFSPRIVEFSPDGTVLALAGFVEESGIVQAIEAQTGKLLAQFALGERRVTQATLSAKADWLAYAIGSSAYLTPTRDRSGHNRNPRDRPPPRSIAHEVAIAHIAFSPDESLLATAGGRLARLWDVRSGREVARVVHEGPVRQVAFKPDGTALATAAADGTVRLWSLEAIGSRRAVRAGWVAASALSPDGRFLATADYSADSVVLSHLQTGGGGRELAVGKGWMAGHLLALSADGQRVATSVFRSSPDAGDAHGVVVIDTSTGQDVGRVPAATTGGFAFSADGRSLATSAEDQAAVQVWEASGGRLVATLPRDGKGRVDLLLSRAAEFLVGRDGNGRVDVWHVPSGRRIIQARSSGPVELSLDGRYLAAAGSEGQVEIFDLSRAVKVAQVSHDAKVRRLRFSPSGRRLAIGGGATVQVCRGDGGEVLSTVTVEVIDPVFAFSPDDRFLAIGSGTTVHVWDASRREEVARILLERRLGDLAFTPDAKFIATATIEETSDGETSQNEGRAWLWHPADMIADACARATRNLTRSEWDQLVRARRYRRTCPDLPEPPMAAVLPRASR